MPRASVVMALFAIALCARLAAAGEQPAPPPPNHWILVVPPGSTVVVPGDATVVRPTAYRPKYYSPRDPARLRRAMEIEGPEFSKETLDGYRYRRSVGLASVLLGGACLYASFYLFIAQESEWAGYVAVGGAFTALAVGVPLIVSGALGRKRQLLLWRKDEIMRGPYWRAGIAAGPGGASLGASIVF